jgi:hypothetical protein
MSTDLPEYTIGQLILDLESSEKAYQDNLRTANRVEAKDGHNLVSNWWRFQASTLLFQPDPARHPGIDRIEALCDEWGTGLKAENVRKLRGKVCSKLGVGVTEANTMTLDAVATILGIAAEAKAADGASPSPPNTAEDLPAYNTEEQIWWASLPQTLDVASEELTSLAGAIDIVLVTATDSEVEALLRRLDPYPGRPGGAGPPGPAQVARHARRRQAQHAGDGRGSMAGVEQRHAPAVHQPRRAVERPRLRPALAHFGEA